ncbi:Serine/threonine protein kinase [Coemansia sp. RSA 552]|nr:Serine/threonine protein kinase [Coemansia sp. RSA 552]
MPGSMVGHSIDNGNLQFVKLIGVGTYGEVYHAVDRRSGESYAVKVLPRKAPGLAPTADEAFVDARLLSREVALYARIPAHSSIVRLERMLHTHNQLFMVMEFCGGGDLYENISKNPYFRLPGNDALIRRLFLQLVSAIAHCHQHGVYHRDIKPENVLLSRDGLNVKLIDFGLSTSDRLCREIGCGSAYYMSPECQGGITSPVDRYAAAPNDVWALGVILINLATGRNPWNRAHTSDPLFSRFLSDKSFLCQAIRATPPFEHIIHRVLDINPDSRCTLDELRLLVKSCSRFIAPHAPPSPQTPSATRVAAAVRESYHHNHNCCGSFQPWFPSGLASPDSMLGSTPNVPERPPPADPPAPRPNNRRPVRVAQRTTGAQPRPQLHHPADSTSCSSEDSVHDACWTTAGYPLLTNPRFTKSPTPHAVMATAAAAAAHDQAVLSPAGRFVPQGSFAFAGADT